MDGHCLTLQKSKDSTSADTQGEPRLIVYNIPRYYDILNFDQCDITTVKSITLWIPIGILAILMYMDMDAVLSV